MKKLSKSPQPNELTAYATNHPQNNWDNDFRNHATATQQPGDDYRAIKKRLIDDQGGLCGYCEQKIGHLNGSLQRIEHYHPKSDNTNPAINWALLWSNILVVCSGGEKEGATHALPANLSCDAHKNHQLNKQAPVAIAAALAAQINPFNAPAFPCLFIFDKQTGELQPNLTGCQHLEQAQGLPAGSLNSKVQNTLELLNLNCDRLCQDRLKVRNEYNRAVKEAREKNDAGYRQKLTERWFSKRWPSFFTTRRILLGEAGEVYLQQILFQG